MVSVDIRMQASALRASECLRNFLYGKRPVFLCIGSDKVIGDSLGPMVGSKLVEHSGGFVYGMLGKNVNALNLNYAAEFIRALHRDCCLVVVDSAIGEGSEVGTVQMYRGGLFPGAATNKNLPKIGDVSILGVVSERGINEFLQLQTTKVSLVEQMSEFIFRAIQTAVGV